MSRLRILSLLVLLALITAMLTACPIVPYRFRWEISTVYCDVTYINGSTIKTEMRQGVDYFKPLGIHNESTYIEFFEDNTLIFKPIDADEIKGTYKCKNNGIKDTTIYITLANGDSIEALGFGGYFEDTLELEYRNVKYEFSADLKDVCADQDEFNEQIRQMAEHIRYLEANPSSRTYFISCTVELDENGGARLISGLEEMDLYSESIGVTAIRITDNNEVVYLDEIEAGECYFYSGYPISYYTNETPTVISLYYLDPLPKNEEENPKALNIFGLIPELEAYYEDEAKENLTVKMSREIFNASSGTPNYYNYVTSQEDIESILSLLENMVLWDYGAPSDDYFENPYSVDSIILTDNSGTLPEIIITNYYDRVKIGDKYYYHNSDEFPAFIYEGAFMMLALGDYSADVYNENELLGATSILENIEYIIDPNQDYTYSATHETRTLITELGEITVYDALHFRYKGQFYLVVGSATFEELFQMN